MENIEYSEWVPIGALVKGLFAMVSLFIVIVTFAFLFSAKDCSLRIFLGFWWLGWF